MKISLIMPTVDRYDDVKKFLTHLGRQTFKDYELIIVDQNEDDRIHKMINALSPHYEFKILNSDKGISKARNLGLKHVKGEIVAFPDDDCWYPDNLLESVEKFFKNNVNFDGLSCCSRDSQGKISVLNFEKKDAIINKYNLWKNCYSPTIFLRREFVKEVGRFDEILGVGSGGGEEMDYIIRGLNKGFRIFYSYSINIYHEHKLKYHAYSNEDLNRVYKYSDHSGRVINNYYPRIYLVYMVLINLRAILISCLFFNFKKAKMLWYKVCGLMKGYGFKL